MSAKRRVFWPLLLVVLLTDCATKRLAVDHLTPHVPRAVAGDAVRLTLAYNRGAAFGTFDRPGSRWFFTATSLVVLAVMAQLYRATPPSDRRRVAALGLIFGGAVGNLVDRVRSPRGVVDFVDIGLGDVRFWTFNVADIGVSIGGALLVWALWRERDTPIPREGRTSQP